MGLRSLKQHAAAAYIASHNSCTDTVTGTLEQAVATYNSKVDDNKRIEDDITNCTSQKKLSDHIDEQTRHDIQRNSNMADQARLESISAPHAADWLRCVPSPGLQLTLTSNEVNTLVRWWLGIDIFPEQSTCPKCKAHQLDQYGQHALTCKFGPNVCHRHNVIRDNVAEYCRHAQLSPRLEEGAGLARDQRRPADVLIPVWNLGNAAALDITVVNPLNATNITGAISTVGSVTSAAATRKHEHNDAKCIELGWECIPLVVTTYGEWGSEASDFLSQLATRVCMQSVARKGDVLDAIYCRLSLALMRCNARAMLCCGSNCAIGTTELLRSGF